MSIRIEGELFTVEETAKALELTPASVRQYAFHGRLAPTKVGRSLFIAKTEIERFKAARWPQGKHRPKS